MDRLAAVLVAGRNHATWNLPLAWIRAQRLAAARGLRVRSAVMRDTDQDLTSVVVVGAVEPFATLGDLEGKMVAVGVVDSPQPTLIPLVHLRAAGLRPGQEITVRRFDLGVGLHGDRHATHGRAVGSGERCRLGR
jgi:phosphonate transport system substrate-binding protein